MKHIIVALFALILLVQAAYAAESVRPDPFRVLYFEIDSIITAAQADMVSEAIRSADAARCDLVLMRLNTVGGTVDAMRSIVTSMLNSNIPVAVWVGPSGAHAASAGTFIVGASAVAAMSPQSNIGSAHPVDQDGESMPDVMEDKLMNDLGSLMRSLTENKSRNMQWYLSSIADNANLTAQEAVMNGVVEYIAVSPQDFIAQIAARGLAYKNDVFGFDPDNVLIIRHETSLRHQLLSWLMDPQIAYLLLMAGLIGLFFEIITPGAILPGVFGGVCMLLGLYAMSMIPTNVAGLLLIVFGVIMFILEAKVISFGLLGLTGALSLFFGSVMLFSVTYSFTDPLFLTILVTTIGTALIFGGIIMAVAKTHLTRPKSGIDAMIGREATIRTWENGHGTIIYRGEMWKAETRFGYEFKPGERVRIVGVDGLVVQVSLEE